MNQEMKKQLEAVINATVNEDTQAAKDAFHAYITAKTQQILLGEDVDGTQGVYIVLGANGDEFYHIVDAPSGLTTQQLFSILSKQGHADCVDALQTQDVSIVNNIDQLNPGNQIGKGTLNDFIEYMDDLCVDLNNDRIMQDQQDAVFGKRTDPNYSGPLSKDWVGH